MSRNIGCAALLSLALCGCGTMDNMVNRSESKIYGGVRNDMKQAAQATRDAASAPNAREFARSTGIGVLSVVDMPLSAVGDTVTLPSTIRAARTQ